MKLLRIFFFGLTLGAGAFLGWFLVDLVPFLPGWLLRDPVVLAADGLTVRESEVNRAREALAHAGVSIAPDPGSVARQILKERRAQKQLPDVVVPPARVAELARDLRSQGGTGPGWEETLAAAEISQREWEQELATHLAAQQGFEEHIARAPAPSETALREYFDSHPADFALPARWKARHLFVAVPPGTPEEVARTKEELVEETARRLAEGEEFAALVLEVSEDEATRGNGGDLGWFSAARMPPDFIANVAKLEPGRLSPPLRTRLGYHFVLVTEVLPPRTLSFEEARPEIASILENLRRREIVAEPAKWPNP